MFPQDKIAGLSLSPIFQGIALHDLLSGLEWLFLPGGETLFHAGAAGDSMYVVLSGRLRVVVPKVDGGAEIVRELGQGESVGELALLTGAPRSATVLAIRDTELVRITQAAFERVIRDHPPTFRRLAAQIAERQSRGTENLSSRRNLRTIAVLPLEERAPARFFTRRLVATLARSGSTLHLTEPPVGGIHLLESCQQPALHDLTASSLNALELGHRFVVYEAGLDFSPWTTQCLRQADLILIVAAAGLKPQSPRFEAWAKFFADRMVSAGLELVLLHKDKRDAALPASPWLRLAPLNDHHHILPGRDADMERLVRRLTGTAVSLVLSGGGARGFAHIGVIRALTERGIPIDAVGGTSMGAVIAAQYALGWDWQTLAQVNGREWPRSQPQKDYTLPLVALNSGRRMDQMLENMFGGVVIESLPIRFFCVSTNLTLAEAKIHETGSLWKAVRASLSIPGIGPPAIENGEILVDGGLVDNLPVGVMQRLCPGRVYAVDVSEQLEFKSSLKDSYTLSGWRLLGQRLNPFAKSPDIPNLLHILYRTTTAGSIGRLEEARSLADCCLSPPVQRFGIFDWQDADRIIEAGYRYAWHALERTPAVSSATPAGKI